jgi:hypothetical protein
MIASLVCSVYIIYLYRKLNAAEAPEAMNDGNSTGTLQSEIATLNAKIDALEKLLRSDQTLVNAP